LADAGRSLTEESPVHLIYNGHHACSCHAGMTALTAPLGGIAGSLLFILISFFEELSEFPGKE
jgi:hypothetical protein